MSVRGGIKVDYELPGYRVLQRVGEGNSAVVYQVQQCYSDCERSSRGRAGEQTQVAKVIPRRFVTVATRREVELHLGFRHENIVTLRQVVAGRNMITGEDAMAIVMDYACAGDMFEEVSCVGGLPAKVVRQRLADIVAALTYLHQQRCVAHLDVKLENVVITKSSTAKLIDFGCARSLEKQTCSSAPQTALGGTLHYLSPESVANGNTAPTTAMDAWALGVLLYTALVGSYPFSPVVERSRAYDFSDVEEERLIKERIVRSPPHPFPPNVSVPSDLRRIVSHLLEKDASRRMTVNQVAVNLQISASVTASLYTPLRARPLFGSSTDRLEAVRSTGVLRRKQQHLSNAKDCDLIAPVRHHSRHSDEEECNQSLLSALCVVDALLDSSREAGGLQTSTRSRSSRVGSIQTSCSSESTHGPPPPEPQTAL